LVADTPVFNEVAKAVTDAGYEAKDFCVGFNVPTILDLREKAAYLYLSERFPDTFPSPPSKKPTSVTAKSRKQEQSWTHHYYTYIKEALNEFVTKQLAKTLKMAYNKNSPLQITVTLTYPKAEVGDKELMLPVMTEIVKNVFEANEKPKQQHHQGQETAPQKQQKKKSRRKPLSRQCLVQVLEYVNAEDFKEANFLPPPALPRDNNNNNNNTDTAVVMGTKKKKTNDNNKNNNKKRKKDDNDEKDEKTDEDLKLLRVNVKLKHLQLYIQGRYLKLVRNVSQTPWVLWSDDGDHERKTETSVQEEIAKMLLPHIQPTSVKFHTGGREDADVRMLGNGRPFVLEFVNPHRTLTEERVRSLEKVVNDNSEVVKVRNLQLAVDGKASVANTAIAAKHKRKVYRARVQLLEHFVRGDVEQRINNAGSIKVMQKTPIRVLHRRTLMIRPKMVHDLRIHEWVGPREFDLDLTTEAGTYVKEFVHGDRGRTRPYLGDVLGIETDILQLDVIGLLELEPGSSSNDTPATNKVREEQQDSAAPQAMAVEADSAAGKQRSMCTFA